MTPKNLKILPAGDSGILVKFGNEITEEINRKVHDLHHMLEDAEHKGIVEMVPAYSDLLIIYDPLLLDFDELKKEIQQAIEHPKKIKKGSQRLLEIPTCYEDEYGADLKEVAEHTGLSAEEIIKIHSETEYLVYMLGFTPGFSYLGGMDERIACPRKKVPREIIPAGSVGIADKQTGIYPIESPGGWQLIGRTPFNLFDPNAKENFLCRAGDKLKFVPINKSEYKALKKEQAR